jgi:pilus assembly protein FimV
MKLLAIRLSSQKTPAKSLASLKLLGLAALMFSTAVTAVGMGGINVSSGLGEKLQADIDLVAVTKSEKASLVARLASPDSYKNSGIEYPYNNKFKFEIASRADGEPYLKINSEQPINDPFVVMMVELNWSAGRLVREYTFLLDPPNYVADKPVLAAVQPVAPEVQVALVETAASAVEQVPPVVAATEAVAVPTPVEVTPVEQVTPATAPVETKLPPTVTDKPVGKFDIATKKSTALPSTTTAADSYVVNRGDTLAKIATEDMSSGVSLERTLLALYRANIDQFDGKNMNRLSVGKTLRLPSEKEITSVTQAEAVTEIRAQAEDWNSYRQKLAGAASTSTQSQETQQVATGKINSSVADKTPVAKESAKEVLKLSKGEAPGDKAASGANGKTVSVLDQKNSAQEDAIAKAKSLKEGQARSALLEKNLKDMDKLAQLKVEAAALAQKQAPVVDAPKINAASAAAAVAVVKPAADVKPKAKEVKPEPSLLDAVLAEPMYLAGGGAGLLGLLGLGWIFARRKKTPVFEDEFDTPKDMDSTMGRVIDPVMPSPETGDFTQEIPAQAQTIEHSDDVDPISEADLFLNFGRDVQAEEILKEAILNTPNNHQIHLKLLGIYANRKDLPAFENIARQLQDSGDESAFKQASDLGRGIDPRNVLYGGSEALEDAGSATMQAPAFGVSEKKASAISKTATVDFDLGAEPISEPLPSPERHFLDDSQKTVSMPAVAGNKEVSLPNLDDLIFDVTGSHPTLQMGKLLVGEQEEPAQVEDAGMEFTLDYPGEEAVDKAAPQIQVPAVDFAGINLNFDNEVAESQSLPQDRDENWQEAATKLDLAKAYQEMGDGVGAREILEEVLREGDAEQREIAQTLIDQIA